MPADAATEPVHRRVVVALASSLTVVLLLCALVATGVIGPSDDGDEVATFAPDTPRRASTTTTTTAATTTAAPTTTVAPTTTAAPITTMPTSTVPTTTAAPAPPPPPAPPPVTAPPPPPPVRVMVAGDSLGFTAAFPLPTPWELPASISSVTMYARIGCGVLSAASWMPDDVQQEGAARDCGDQERRELEGLGQRPDWMVFFSGGWEHLGWTAPNGRVVPARSPELRAELIGRLLHRARTAAQHGTRTAFVAWVCPTGVLPHRQGDYAHWYNGVLREVSRSVPGSIVVEATDRVCVRSDAGGAPTPEKAAAFRDHHPVDKTWTWQVWLGPALEAAR